MAFGMKYGDKDRLIKLFQFIIEKADKSGLYPLYYGGTPHYSTNLLVYLSGRALGFAPDSGELKKIREYLKSKDIFSSTNMETKLLLATYGLIPWNSVPVISPLLLLLPNDADFTIYSISYWVRTSLVPMAILYSKKYSFPSFPLSSSEITDLSGGKNFPPFISTNKMWDFFLNKLESSFCVDANILETMAIKNAKNGYLLIRIKAAIGVEYILQCNIA